MELGELVVRGARRKWEDVIRLRCDAAACLVQAGHGRPLLLASVCGPESAVKAFTAALHGTAKVQIESRVGGKPVYAERWPRGYKVYRAALGFSTWHALAVAKMDGLILALSEETLWRELRTDRYTTPILRQWVPWLMERLLETGGLVKPEQAGCECGYLAADTEDLDKLVSEGLRSKALKLRTPAAAEKKGKKHVA